MPQATDKQRIEWGGVGGVGEDKAWDFLEEHGWTQNKGVWHPNKEEDQVTDLEWGALNFLIDEWDHGYYKWYVSESSS